MTADTLDIAWPRKVGEARDPVMNSKLWNDFAFAMTTSSFPPTSNPARP